VAGFVVRRSRLQLSGSDEVGQHGAPLRVKPAPLITGANHFRRGNAGNEFAGLIPVRYFEMGINHKGCHRATLQKRIQIFPVVALLGIFFKLGC
jgi:hypothetical protein